MQTPTLNSVHISIGAICSAVLVATPIVWVGLIRPQLVLAADLQPLRDTVKQIQTEVSHNKATGQHIKIHLFEIRIEGYQEKIRELESNPSIAPDDDYRLREYRAKVDKLERELRRLEAEG